MILPTVLSCLFPTQASQKAIHKNNAFAKQQAHLCVNTLGHCDSGCAVVTATTIITHADPPRSAYDVSLQDSTVIVHWTVRKSSSTFRTALTRYTYLCTYSTWQLAVDASV